VTNAGRTVEIIRLLGEFDFVGVRKLLSPSFVQEYPYPPMPGAPERIEGVDAFVEFCRPGMTAFDPYAFQIEEVYETTDPDVVIAEYTSHTRLRATGAPYSNHYIAVFVFGPDGRLAVWREYLNPQTIADTFGT
jgi:ketosteroid isomerase-like protein